MKFKKILSVMLIVFVFSLGCGFTSCFGKTTHINYNNTPTNKTPNIYSSTEETSISTIAEDYMGAIATVYLTKNSSSSPVSFGSGIAVADGGFLVTNYHVVSSYVNNPDTYKIKLQMMLEISEGENELATEVPAKLLWYDANLDLAVLRSEQNFQTIVPMVDRWIEPSSKLRIAEKIWTLGTPAEIELFGSYSEGTISSLFKRVCGTSVDNTLYVHSYMIQHNASISSGNSGGGLFDVFGNLVGLNTCGSSSGSGKSVNDLYYAIPIYPVTLILDKIIEQELDVNPLTNYKAASLGITAFHDKYYQDYSTDYSFDETGVFVSKITANSNGALAGLEVGSVLTGISDAQTAFMKIECVYDYIYALLSYDVGDTVTLYFSNNGTPLTKEIVLE